MDIGNVLQTPPVFFRLFVKLALSLVTSAISVHYPRTVVERRLPASFDVDTRTGFFPPQPLPTLTEDYSIYEDALREARGNLPLAEDDSEEAVEKRPFGERWRANIRSVSTFFPSIHLGQGLKDAFFFLY